MLMKSLEPRRIERATVQADCKGNVSKRLLASGIADGSAGYKALPRHPLANVS
jgi:hypothetical protein